MKNARKGCGPHRLPEKAADHIDLTVVMTDVVGSSKGRAFYNEHDTKMTWELYEKLCTHYEPFTRNTWGDGLAVNFKDAIDAITFVKALFMETKRQKYRFLKFRIAVHHSSTGVLQNPVTKSLDLFGEGVLIAARLEPVIRNGSTLITEEVYNRIKKEEALGTFTEPLPIKPAKDMKITQARYFEDCCTDEAKDEIKRQRQRISDEQKIDTKPWFELMASAYDPKSQLSEALANTDKITIYFINGGETGESIVEALRYRFLKLKKENRLILKKIILATLKVEETEKGKIMQDKMLKESGLLTNIRQTHAAMVKETKERFEDLINNLAFSKESFRHVEIPWPPLGAILLTDTIAYIRPCVYFEDAKKIPVICAGNLSEYYMKYSKALNEAIVKIESRKRKTKNKGY